MTANQNNPEEMGNDFLETWNLVLKVTAEAKDDLVESLRIPLFLELCQKEKRSRKNNTRELASSLWSFRAADRGREIPSIGKALPLFLFASLNGAHLLNLLPVATEAKRRELLGGVVTAGRDTDKSLGQFDPVMSERAFLSLAGLRHMPRVVRNVRRSFKNLVCILSRYSPDAASRIRRNFGWFLKHMVESARVQIAARNLFSEWRPSCVIATCDLWPYEFQFFRQASRMGIPNAVIQHGELNGVANWPICADTCLLWGDVFRDKLLTMGASPEKVRVCGMPAADDLFQRFHNTTPKTLDQTSPVCLVLSHSHDRFEEPDLFGRFKNYLSEAIRLTPHCQWRIKLHPNEDDSFYRDPVFSTIQVLPRTTTLQQSVEQADVVCTIRSTAGLQAMMMQRPLIITDLVPGAECSVWWPLHGGGLAARTPGAFKKLFDAIVESNDYRQSVLAGQREFLDKSFANKGTAASSIVDYLAELTPGSREAQELQRGKKDAPVAIV